MKKSAMILFFILTFVSSISFAATLSSIDKDQMKQAFVNKTFTTTGTFQLGNERFIDTFTGSMDEKGKIHGKFSHKHSHNPQSDEGVYTIQDDGQLCITWQHWENNKQFCVYAYNTENAYLMVEPSNIFHVAFLKADIK